MKTSRTRPLGKFLSTLLIAFCFITAPAVSQPPAKLSDMKNLVCYYSPELGELSLALLSMTNNTHPRHNYSFRSELEVKLEIDQETSAIIDNNSLKVAVLGDYRSISDRKYTLFRFNIVIDESTSIEDVDLSRTRGVIESFLGKIPVTFEIQVIRFSDQVLTATGFTKDMATFLAALNAPRLRGGTAFYDAFDQGMKELMHAPGTEVPLSFTIAFTDGEDTSSSRFPDFESFKSAMQMQAEREQVFMFIAGIGSDGNIQHELLDQVPGRKGFYYPLPDVSRIEELFEAVANALDRTYIVRIPIVSSHQGTKTVYILQRNATGSGHSVIQDVPLPASCIP